MTAFPFKTAAALEAAENFERFVALAKETLPWDVDWHSTRWPIPSGQRQSADHDTSLNFVTHPVEGRRTLPLDGQLAELCRAIVVHKAGSRVDGYSHSALDMLVRAFRYLYAVTRDRDPSVANLTYGDFDRALNLSLTRDAYSTAKATADGLRYVARIVDLHYLAARPVQWKRSMPVAHKPTVGKEAEKLRDKALPSEAALDAIADLANADDLEPQDLIRQRAIELFAACGFRLNECLTLPRHPIVEEPVLGESGAQMLDRFGNPLVKMALRYVPEKGGPERLKPVPTVMIDVVRRAIADIQRITEPAARAAKFMHNNPGKLLLGEPWDSIDDDVVLPPADIARMVGLWTPNLNNGGGSGRQFMKRYKLPTHDCVTVANATRRGRLIEMRMPSTGSRKGDICAVLLTESKLGNVLGKEGHQELHDSLFVVQSRFFHKVQMEQGHNGVVRLMTQTNLAYYIASSNDKEHRKLSIFERRGLTDENGDIIRLTSHQFRRWLNTMALEGGLSDQELARWMGRKDIRQNAAYDFSRPRVRAAAVREAMNAGEVRGPVGEAAARINDPVRREEFVQSAVATVHVTDIGYCTLDWTSESCPEFGACETCTKNLIVKGDTNSRERTARLRDEVAVSVEIAEAEDADGTEGADYWYLSHKARLKNLDRTLAIHDDPEIPDGTLIQLEDDGWKVLSHDKAARDAA